MPLPEPARCCLGYIPAQQELRVLLSKHVLSVPRPSTFSFGDYLFLPVWRTFSSLRTHIRLLLVKTQPHFQSQSMYAYWEFRPYTENLVYVHSSDVCVCMCVHVWIEFVKLRNLSFSEQFKCKYNSKARYVYIDIWMTRNITMAHFSHNYRMLSIFPQKHMNYLQLADLYENLSETLPSSQQHMDTDYCSLSFIHWKKWPIIALPPYQALYEAHSGSQHQDGPCCFMLTCATCLMRKQNRNKHLEERVFWRIENSQ